MARTRDFAAAAPRAAALDVKPAIDDKFARAKGTIAHQPTGFDAPQAMPTFTGESGEKARFDFLVGRYGQPVEEIWTVAEAEENPRGARKVYLQKDIEDMANKLRRDGQLVAVLGTRRGDRRILIDGGTRKRAAPLAGLTALRVSVFPNVSNLDLYEISASSNDDRKGHSALDNALSWQQMLAEKDYESESQIAERRGIDLATVNKTLAILRLPVEVLDIVRSDPGAFGMSVLYELLKLSEVAPLVVTIEQTEKLLRGEVSRRDLTELRTKYASPRTRKPKDISRQYKLWGSDGGQAGVVKEWDNGRVTLDITFVSAEDRIKLVDDLKARFKGQEDPGE